MGKDVIARDSLSLQQYGYNLTHIAREGRNPPLRGYEAAVARLFDILLRWGDSRKKCNPLLLDEDEKRRWQVVMEAVRCMAAGEAPQPSTIFTNF
jgi:ATP-dependent Clp protease ATP-binding subunit ClpA